MIILVKILIITVSVYSIVTSFSQDELSIKIGEQEWMKKNLAVTKFRNGDLIPEAQTPESWEMAGKKGQPAWCYYENNSFDGEKYGKLYNWFAVNDPRGIAPEGWKVPNNLEWQILIKYLGGENVAGGKMKESGNKHWKVPNKGATNESEFTALAGGLRYIDGEYNDLNDDSYFWSSTEYNKDSAWYFVLGHYFTNIYSNYYNKRHGFSVRCIRD